MADPQRLLTTASEHLVAGLNPAQREAVTAVDGPVLVVAGAGSGKTRVLTHRIAHLIRDHDVSPFAILAITFTNKAAGEMAERVGRLVGEHLGQRMWVTTFHKACVRILRREVSRLGYASSFTIYDEADSVRLIAQVVKDLGIDDRRLTPKGIKHAISRAKDHLVDFEAYAAHAGDYLEQRIAEVYEGYQQRLLRSSALDFDDLIVKTVEILELFPEVLAHYQERFRYLLVDEYQDTNRAQYHLVNRLAAAHRNLMVVGDADQCLPPGTQILTPDGAIPIEDVDEGTLVVGTGGSVEAVARPVRTVRRGEYHGPLWRVRAGDRLLSGTPHHIVPARLEPEPGRWFVYLMYRTEDGCCVGITTSARLPQWGAVWILAVCASAAEAAARVARLTAEYADLDTEVRAKQLMADLCLHPDYPHHQPQGGARRQSVNLIMYQDARHGEVGYHRVHWSSNRRDLAERLEHAGFPVRTNGRGGWRVEASRKDYRDALALTHSLADMGGLRINRRASIDGNVYRLQPLSNLFPGMRVLVWDGSRLAEKTVEHVEVGFHAGPVYDLEVSDIHTYVANGVLTHNSVYSFRGATIQNLLDFEHDYPDARVIRLTQNYRSTQTILDAANTVIRNNVARQPKDLWTDRGTGPRVVRYEAEDEHDEAAFVAEEVERLRTEGTAFGDVAVFYRTNAQARVLEEVFVRVGTPYRVIGGVRFYERREVKDLLAYLRVLVNPDDEVSARRVVNVPRRGIGSKTEDALALHARREGIGFLAACRQVEHLPGLGPRAVSAVTSFVDLLDLLRTLHVEGMNVPDLIEAVWQRTGYMAELQAERTIEALGREENLRELQSVAQEFHERDPDGDLAGFLESVTLVSEQDEITEEEGRVTFMTLHNAKGLEFPVVFLVGLEDGVFPHVRSLSEPAQLEEERRLCYVGLTRAQDRLYLAHAGHRRLWGGVSYNPPSRFLRELPKEMVEVRAGTGAARRVRDREVYEVDGEEFRVGDRVLHSSYGAGVIVQLTGAGDDAEATVEFEDEGRKHLLMAYAPLVRA